eukprot:TRINITY_DN11079_c0_g1_i1.p1 TRINITY_DN11079_c0_g1~~TRINITY_DN11079_c0_g1_i1.p1  ORF type:complete len:125 (+),score=6.71 TRINITY_DN11079_c0_g1_i1:260-634(+)
MADFSVSKSAAEWQKLLGPSRYKVMRQDGTERPGTSEYDRFAPKTGYFACFGCEYPLYTANSKFTSTCGWPCYDQVVYSDEGGCHVGTKSVWSPNTLEIHCNKCGSHLGHVFYGERCTPKNERH